MSVHPENQTDHSRIVAFLAKESQLPLADVARLYEVEFAKLAVDARVTQFLDIIAIRHVQAILRNRVVDKLGARSRGRTQLAL